MKRFLSAGKGYVPNSLTYKLLSPFKRYIQTSSPNKFGWLAYPSWGPKVTGIQVLVALLKSSASCNFSFLRTSCIYLGLFFMCLQAAIANQPDPATDRAAQVAEDLDLYSGEKHMALYQLSGRSNLKPLKISQKVPRNLLIGDPVFNLNSDRVTTADFRGRAVIIDVWATWCGSCISQFPKLDSLRNIFANHLDIYLLNNLYRDSEQKIITFLEEFKQRFPDFNLPLLVGNLDTRALFPGGVLPHYVWIDANGRVKAITGSDDVTSENIERLIAGLSIDAKEKLR